MNRLDKRIKSLAMRIASDTESLGNLARELEPVMLKIENHQPVDETERKLFCRFFVEATATPSVAGSIRTLAMGIYDTVCGMRKMAPIAEDEYEKLVEFYLETLYAMEDCQ